MKLNRGEAMYLSGKIREMYYNEGMVASGKAKVSDGEVVVRGRREGVYRYKNMWWKVKVDASTKASMDTSEELRTRLTVRVDTGDMTKTYSRFVTLGLPQERNVTHAVAMECVKDFCDNNII